MSIPFRFDTLLRVREAERDRCRQTLVLEQQCEAALIDKHQRLIEQRQTMMDELRATSAEAPLSAEQELARRQFIEHLATQIVRLTEALQEAVATVEQCRTELLEADTSVKALEKLAGRHAVDQQRIEQAKSERDRDDTWRGGRVA